MISVLLHFQNQELMRRRYYPGRMAYVSRTGQHVCQQEWMVSYRTCEGCGGNGPCPIGSDTCLVCSEVVSTEVAEQLVFNQLDTIRVIKVQN